MERRQLLVLAGSSTAAGLAGCIGNGGDDSENGNDTSGNGNGDSGTATFEVSLGDIADTGAGSEATIPYTVENTGDGSGTQDIVFSVGGEEQDSTSVELESGGTSEGEFTYTPTAEDAPSVDLTVSSDDNEATGSLSILTANFDVSLGDISDVSVGSEATIPYTVENTGDGSGSQDIVFSVGGSEQDSTSLELESGGTSEDEFTYTTTEADAPSVTITVASGDDEAVGSLSVLTGAGGLEGMFRAESTGGYIAIGEDNVDAAQENGFDLPPTDAVPNPIVVEGEINADDGSWESSTVEFPALNPADLLGDDLPIDPSSIDVEVNAPEGFSGTIDQGDEPTMTVEGPLEVEVFLNGDPAFSVAIGLSATTEVSGQLEGTLDLESLSATVVDNETAVDAIEGDSALIPTINDELGLPAESGQFWVSIDFSFQNLDG